jgi:GGDEF domain-containing protein
MENLSDFVDFVLTCLDECEVRELEKMIADRSSIARGASMFSCQKAERRVDLEKRRRVADMSREEMVRELLTSEVTGLPNRRAFDEAGQAPAIAMSDLDGLKAVNDKYGYCAGDALLKTKAEALRQAELEAYHDKGDEFLYRGNSTEELRATLERARDILRNRTIAAEQSDGTTVLFRGADFSYGAGKDSAEAELDLKRHKDERKARGEIKRGELRGIVAKEREPLLR